MNNFGSRKVNSYEPSKPVAVPRLLAAASQKIALSTGMTFP